MNPSEIQLREQQTVVTVATILNAAKEEVGCRQSLRQLADEYWATVNAMRNLKKKLKYLRSHDKKHRIVIRS